MKIIYLRTEEIRSRHRVCSLERLVLLCKVFSQEHDQERQRSESPDAHGPDSLASTSGKQQRDPASKRTESVVSGARVLHPHTLNNSNYASARFQESWCRHTNTEGHAGSDESYIWSQKCSQCVAFEEDVVPIKLWVCGLLPAHYSKSGIQILFFITLVFSLPFLMLFYLFSALCGSQVLTRSPEPVLLALHPCYPCNGRTIAQMRNSRGRVRGALASHPSSSVPSHALGGQTAVRAMWTGTVVSWQQRRCAEVC